MSRGNGINPDQMTAEARLSELGRIVAAGVLRMREKSSPLSADRGDSSLATLPPKSGGVLRAEAIWPGRLAGHRDRSQ